MKVHLKFKSYEKVGLASPFNWFKVHISQTSEGKSTKQYIKQAQMKASDQKFAQIVPLTYVIFHKK